MRQEFSRKVRSRDVKCFMCGKDFDRGYPISASRSSRPQFCGSECRNLRSTIEKEKNLENRFWEKASIGFSDECWPWAGRVSEQGYGVFDYQGRPQIASRISYWLATGVEPGDLDVCHSCDNPPCVNPKHLWLGTASDNMKDASSKGRVTGAINPRKGRDVNTCRLEEEEVRHVRRSTLSRKELATLYGVSSNAIRLIQLRVNWGWLDD